MQIALLKFHVRISLRVTNQSLGKSISSAFVVECVKHTQETTNVKVHEETGQVEKLSANKPIHWVKYM